MKRPSERIREIFKIVEANAPGENLSVRNIASIMAYLDELAGYRVDYNGYRPSSATSPVSGAPSPTSKEGESK